MLTRRQAALVTIAGAASLQAQTPSFLSSAELAWLAALVDTIIPRTDTPGASDAGVPTFIDRRLAANPALTEVFRSGMKSLDADAQARFGAAFPAVSPEQQIVLLTSRQDEPFFTTLKGLTVDGY